PQVRVKPATRVAYNRLRLWVLLNLTRLLILHTRNRCQSDLNATVLCTAISRGVAGNRIGRAFTRNAQVLTADTLRRQVGRYALRTLLGQLHVVVVVTRAVGITNNLNLLLVVELLQRVCQCIERLVEAWRNAR